MQFFIVLALLLLTPLAKGSDVKTIPCDSLLIHKFDYPVNALEKFFKDHEDEKADQFAESILKEDLRGAFFRIQALLRILKKTYGTDYDPVLASVKNAEDLIGIYSAFLESIEFAKKIKIPNEVIQVLQNKYFKSRSLAVESLRNKEFISNLKASIKSFEKQINKTSLVQILEVFRKELKKIEPLDYDMDDLQGGVHELRRQLRWILIYIQTLRGMIQFNYESKELELNEYSYLLTHPIANSRFSKIEIDSGSEQSDEPHLVSFYLFLALSKYVDEIGAAKSFGENIRAVSEAYAETNLVKSRAEAYAAVERLVIKSGLDFYDYIKQAKAIKKEMKRTELLKVFRKEFE